MDVTSFLATDTVRRLLVAYPVQIVKRRVRYLFHFNQIVEELRELEKILFIEQTRVQEEVNEAKRHIQTQVIEKYVLDWLTEAENVLNEVQKLEYRIQENKRCFCCCPNWSWRYQLTKRIKQKRVAIRILVESSKFDRIYNRVALPGIEFFESKGLLAPKSSSSASSEIMQALNDDGVNVIAVWGTGGVGKTTLVTEVCNRAKSLELFHKSIFIVVSHTPDIGKIQDRIADVFDLQFENWSQEAKAEELRLRLEKEEKVLIILDDMWNGLDLKEIGIPFSGDHKGCKIILTTRSRQVCELMESQLTVTLSVLDEDEAWALFQKNASLDENASADIIDVAKKIAKECNDQPIAIVTLARALRSKDINGWESALEELRSPKLMDFENNAYYCLQMTYDHLRSETTKRCFLLCALYPEDYSIDVEDLVRYAWGLRLYQNADSIKEVRREVTEAIDDLKDSCLLLEADKERYIKMHDMARDLALPIASKESYNNVIKLGIGSHNKYSGQMFEILLPDNYDCKTPIECFEGMQELQVLILRTTSESNDSFFSLNAVISLTNLRTLQLEGFKQLKDISALAKLTELEILSLHGSQFLESIDILGELKNLRVLDLRQCTFLLGFPLNLIQRLVKVEELYLSDLIIKRLVSDEASISTAILSEPNFLPKSDVLSLEVPSLHFPEGFIFPRLERYEIAINVRRLEDPNAIFSSRSLRISGVLPLKVISNLLCNVEFLGLSNIMEKDIECLTDTRPGNMSVGTILQNLKHVSIDKCMNVQVIFQMKKAENHAMLLSKLKGLWLCGLPNLKYIWEMPTQHISLRSLEAVKIDGCGKLKSLFSLPLAQSLVRLQRLEINDCGELDQIVEEDDGQEISPSMNPEKYLCLPSLETLEIYNCEHLVYIFPNFMASQGLLQLKRLSLENLSRLKQIWRSTKQREENGIRQILPSLRELKVHDCLELTDIAELETMRPYLKEASIINTKKLLLQEITNRNLIPEKYPDGLNKLIVLKIEKCKDLQCLVDTAEENVPDSVFSDLKELFLSGMDCLKMLCNGQFPKGLPQNLKKLTIEHCGRLLEELFFTREENQAQLLSNLEHLELESLPELRGILKGPARCFSLQSLKVVNISSCKSLKSLFSFSLIESLLQLQELKIRGCDQLETLFEQLEINGETGSSSHLHPPSLPRLTSLHISKCPRLEYVLPITMAQGLPQLESVLVATSPQLTQVFGVAKEHNGVEYCIRLPHLKHLELDNLTKLSSFGSVNYFVEAPALEKLSIYASPHLKFTIQQEVNQGSRLFAFKEFLRHTKDLTSLKLDGCKDLERLADTTEEHEPTGEMFTNLVELVLKNMSGLKMLCNGQPPKSFLQKLENLTVERCVDIVSLNPVAQNLKKLTVEDCEKLQEVFRIDEENQAELFSNLEYLELFSVPELRSILKGPTDKVSLRNLKVVKIRSCDELKSLFSVSVVQNMRSLEELQICYCHKLKSVFLLESTDDDKKESETLSLPNLHTVEIIDCPRLEYVFPFAFAQGFPRLQRVQLCYLTNLSNFVAKAYRITAPLEILRVYQCPRLMNFTAEQEAKWMPLVVQGILMNSRIPVGSPIQATKLRELRLYGCDKFTHIFSSLIRNLPQLSILHVIRCENLKQIILPPSSSVSSSSSQGPERDEIGGVKDDKEMKMFPQLKELRLEDLPSLETFGPIGCHLRFPSLEYLEIQNCPEMIASFTEDSTSSVLATTKATRQGASPSEDIYWKRHEPTPPTPPSQLSQIVEEPNEISALT